MKKLLLLLALLLVPQIAGAATYYVRNDGGTRTQCTGTFNAPYPGAGSAQSCSFNHPAWALGSPGVAGIMVGGDSLVIDDVDHTTSTQAQYLIGFGMPNTNPANCSASTSATCSMGNIPSGTDAAHPTRILGMKYNTGCTAKPQLWGTQGLGSTGGNAVLNVAGASHIDIECVELTDHSNCGLRVGNPICSESYGGTVGTWARKGIYAKGGGDFTFVNMDVHGFADKGFHMGGVHDITYDHVNMDGNYFPGWDGDVGENGNESAITGNVYAHYGNTRFNGCSEKYPRSATFSASDYSFCVDENSSPPGYSDGWGFFITQGNWFIDNWNFSQNGSDGLDLLYKTAGDVDVDKCIFQANTGNQLKFTAVNASVTNTAFIANCTYIKNNGKNNQSSYNPCRANGTPISATPLQGGAWSFINNSALTSTGGGGSPFIEITNRYFTCNGTETYYFSNNVLKNYNNTWTAYYNGLSGACGSAFSAATSNNSNIYNFTSVPSGTAIVTTNPNWAGTFSLNAPDNLSSILLSASSPGKGAGKTGNTYWNNSNDLNNNVQNNPPDEGCYKYNSSQQCTSPGGACTSTPQCCTGSCTNFTCGGTCVPLSGACTVNGNCCNNNCVSNVCTATCTTNGNACNVDGDCCSSKCCSHVCSAVACPVPAPWNSRVSGQCSRSGNTNLH